LKENTFLNNVKTKASTLGMTALLTINSVSLAFAEQTGGKGTVNPANEANNSINNFSDMLRLLFPGIAILSGLGACILMMMGDKKRTVALDRLMWIAIALCAGSALVSFVDYLWQPK
jgi:mannose/fructose/N-acetylgalactosamine-specific phosphotransferase system component IID